MGMSEQQSLLYKVKPYSDRLPAVTRPEGHVHFRTKLMWVVVILVMYFVMTNIYIYGLDTEGTLDIFAQYRTIMAGASGSIMQLGIGPIVTASIIMQLFVGAKIINLDLTKSSDKAVYQSVQKLLVIVMIVFTAVPQVFGFLEPSDAFVDAVGNGMARFIIVAQLCLGAYLLFLMDDVVSKWGIGSGVSLFIVAGVSEALFTGAINWYPVDASAAVSAANPPAGTIPKTLYILGTQSMAELSQGGYEQILLAEPNPLVALLGTIVIFLFVSYVESSRIELPLAHGAARGARGRYPIKLLYASVIPVILVAALLANLNMFALLFYTSDTLSQVPLIGGNPLIGYFEPGSTTASGGLVWYLSSPNGLNDWLLPILDSASYGNGHSPLQNLMRVMIYFSFMVLGSILFAKFWVTTTNLGPESVARQIQSIGMQIPGFRRDPRVLKRVLERYIPVVTVISGALVGILAASADLIGTTGNTSGTGVLLAVGVLTQFYEAMGREQMMEMHPVLRGFFGGE